MAAPVTRSIICPVLIGRESHLDSLLHFIEQAQHGHGQTVLVSGEAGIGKSRLIAEALKIVRSARVQKAATTTLILEGRCFEPDRTLPYAPMLDMLRSFLAVHSAHDVAVLAGSVAPDLVQLLPEITASLSASAPGTTLDPEIEKRQLFSALLHFFTQLAQDQPLILVIEDMHWSDDNSLEFLLYLARHIASYPILLLLTYRSEEEHPQLLQFFAGLDRERLTTELMLSHLSIDEVEAMVRTIMGEQRPLSADFIAAIYAPTEGNPFFIEEMLKSLVTSGALMYADGKWERKPRAKEASQELPLPEHWHLPRSVQLAVQQRLHHLSVEAREVLSFAAVVGRRFDFVLLQHLSGRSETDLVRLIKELIAAQLVLEESEDVLVFRHALTRQAAYTDLLARERRSLHHSVAQTMERIYANELDSRLGDLAYHFYMAGEWTKVLEYAQRAGEKAQALYAPRAAIEHYTHALEALQRLSQTPTPDLYRARAHCYELLGDSSAAREDYMRVLDTARSAGDTSMELQGLLDLGYLWTGLDYAQAGDYFQRALALARSMNDSSLLARTLNRVGNWHMNLEEPLEGQRYHQEALSIFRANSDQRGLAETLDLLGVASLMSSDLIASAHYYEQTIPLLRALGDRQGLVSSLTFFAGRGGLYFTSTAVPLAESSAECLRDGEEAITLSHQYGIRASESFALIFLGLCLGYRGEYGDALSRAEAGLNIAIEIEHGPWMATGYLLLGILSLELLALPNARRHLEHALALTKECGSLFLIRNATAFLASTCIAQKEYDRAELVLIDVFNHEMPCQTLAQRLVWCARAELELARNHPDKALTMIDRLISTAAHSEDGAVIPRLAHLRGEALIALANMEEAEAELRSACDAARQQHQQPLLWRIYLSLGKLYQKMSLRRQAEEAYAQTSLLIEELSGTLTDAEQRATFLGSASSMLPHLPRLSPRQVSRQEHGGLTGRELEVALLIAQGKASRAIADELVVSERTIEKHIERIMSRLGFSSRVQIATWVVEKGLLNPSR